MRKIAFFVSDIFGAYAHDVMNLLREKGKEKDITFHVFSNYGGYGSNGLHQFGERTVIQIPDLSDYDGILVVPDTFAITGMYEELKEIIKKTTNCPVVSLRIEDSDFYSIVIDNYHSMYHMVEHFIVKHHCKRICFMTGIMSLQDAKERLKAYKDVMAKYQLPVTEDMIFEGDYWKNKGVKALKYFLQSGQKPDAIVCSNDYMAMSILENVHQFGLRVPEDVLVSGFDDAIDAQVAVPPLTTIRTSSQDYGKMALQIFENCWAQKEQKKVEMLELQAVFRASCGCKNANDVTPFRELFERHSDLYRYVDHNIYMEHDFDGTETLEELIYTSQSYMAGLEYQRLAVCLCDESEEGMNKAEMLGKYTNHMILKAFLQPGKTQFLQERFLRKEILPKKYYDEKEPLYVFPIHARGRCYGYVVVQTQNLKKMEFFFRSWKLSFSNAIERIQTYAENKELEKWRQEALRDDMTGIPNRRALDNTLSKYHYCLEQGDQAICIVSLDLDGLKHINDTYGHLAGDDAICTFANILLECAKEKNIFISRTGGDEFVALLQTNSEEDIKQFIDNILERLQEINTTQNKKYFLSTSYGYHFCRKGDNVAECFEMSDRKMYQNKNEKKYKK